MPVTHVPHAQTAGEWRRTGYCPRCKAPVLEMRLGTDAGRQEEHRDWCRAASRKERMEQRGSTR